MNRRAMLSCDSSCYSSMKMCCGYSLKHVSSCIVMIFFIISPQKYIMYSLEGLTEALLMSTHNIYFDVEVRKRDELLRRSLW